MENSVKFAKKQKQKKQLWIELPYDPTILLLGLYSEEIKMGYWRDKCIPMFTAVLLLSTIWEQPKCLSVDKWIKRMVYMCTQWNIIQPWEQKETLPYVTTWMELEDRHYAKWGKSDRETNTAGYDFYVN